MKTKFIFFAVAFSMIFHFAQGQNSTETITEKETRKHEFLISAFAGYPFGGAKDQIYANMKNSGFDSRYDNYLLGSLISSKNYPRSFTWPVFDLEATYFFFRIIGVTINTSIFSNFDVDGYESIGDGNFLSIKNRFSSTAFAITLRTTNNKHHITTGPAYIKHFESGEGNKYIQYNWGLFLEYTFHIQWSEHIFVGMKLNYRWAPDFTSGPFEVEHHTSAPDVGLIYYKSIYNQTNVNPSCLNIGVSLGFSF